MKHLWPLSGILAALMIANGGRADEPEDALKMIRFPTEELRSRNRLLAADRLVALQASPNTAVSLIGAASPLNDWQSLASVTGWLGHRIGNQHWDEALREYQQMLEQSAETVVPATEYATPILQSPQLKTLCHLRIATAPPSILQAYRNRVDTRAKRWLEEAAANRDAKLLRRLVEDMFCSSVADEALELLGDLAFENGRFIEARHWWRRITPSAAEYLHHGVRPALQFPDPDVDLARVRAKQIMATVFDKDLAAAHKEMVAFKELHPAAAGFFAGQTGNYHSILTDMRKIVPTVESVPGENDWATFGGRATRNHESLKGLPFRLWANGPAWRTPLPFEPVQSDLAVRNPSDVLPFHPLIAGNRVFVADHRSVVGYQLNTGKQMFRYDLKTAGHADGVAKRSADTKPGSVFSLTVQDQRLFVRLGRQSLNDKDDATAGYLVCLDLDENPGRELWARRFAGTKEKPVMLEGSPIVRGRYVLSAVSRFEWDQIRTSVICCDVETGETIWTREVSEIPPTNDDRRPAGSHHLLTAAGSHVFLCTHSGAVFALEMETGRPIWAIRYTHPRFHEENHVPHGYGPPVYWNHRVYVAPADSHFVICIDAATGDILWQRDDLDVSQLMGVGRGRLIFTTPNKLRAIDAITGLSQDGWISPAAGNRATKGRGLLAGGWVFWPTHDAKLPVRAVTIEHGMQDATPTFLEGGFPPERYFDPTQLRQLHPGNMAWGDDCLVIATENELIGYVAPKRMLPLLETKCKQPGATMDDVLRLAEAQLDAGKTRTAEVNFQQVLRMKKGKTALRRRALAGSFEIFWNEAAHAKDWQTAAMHFQNAADEQFPVVWRLKSLARLAELYDQNNQQSKAAAIWRTIAKDEALRNGTVVVDGTPHLAQWFASAKLSGKPEVVNHVQKTAAQERSLGETAFPLEVEWKVSPGRLLIPSNVEDYRPSGDEVFLHENDFLVCREANDASVKWKVPLSFQPIWSAYHGELLLLGGPHNLAAYRIADGTEGWKTHIEEWRNALPPTFGPFAVNEQFFFALVNGIRLVAIAPKTGQVAWSSRLPPHGMPPDMERRRPSSLQISGNHILVQTPHTVQIVDAKNGRNRPFPFAIGHANSAGDDWCAVVDANELAMIQLNTKQVKWRFSPPYPESSNGEPMSVIPTKSGVLVFIRRNYGVEVDCLSNQTGRSIWTTSIFFVGEIPNRNQIVVDDEAIYLARSNSVEKYALQTGKRLWRHPLPSTRNTWSISKLSNTLAITSSPPISSHLNWTPTAGAYIGFPSSRFARLSHTPVIRFIQPEDGRLLQEVTWPGPASTITMLQIGSRIVVSDGCHVWSLSGAGKRSSRKKTDPHMLAAWVLDSILVK